MIALCGLDCSVCIARLGKNPPCPGCWSDGEGKPEHCARLCKIAFYEHRRNLDDGNCDKCRHYPCGHILGMEEKYQHEYPMKESLMNNLSEMRRLGMDVFLRNENAKWRCSHCGGVLCVHTGKCIDCGNVNCWVKALHRRTATLYSTKECEGELLRLAKSPIYLLVDNIN